MFQWQRYILVSFHFLVYLDALDSLNRIFWLLYGLLSSNVGLDWSERHELIAIDWIGREGYQVDWQLLRAICFD
jgi:hypothetical protein